jgi:4-hydroxy-tetrahydrodipicolinate synthase
MAERLQGCFTALVTPFDEDGNLAEETLATLVKRQIDGGVDGLVPCGTTGESPTLSGAEQQRVIEITVGEAKGRVPVIAGAGSNDTRHAALLAQGAQKAGADAILSVAPYYNKPPQSGYLRHYAKIAAAVSVPVIIYNVPGRTGGNISPATILELSQVENIGGVKEASGSLDQAMSILQDRPDEFAVLSGDDALTLPMMALGGDGVISVLSNEVPSSFPTMVRHCLEGEFDLARPIHEQLLPLSRANFVETNPVPVKTALALMGFVEPVFRPPLGPMKETNVPILRDALQNLQLI